MIDFMSKNDTSQSTDPVISEITYKGNQKPYNVHDYLRNLSVEEINSFLDKDRSPMVSVCLNLTNDFNKASIIRAANAFLGSEVYMIGKRRYDKRGAVGTYHYEHIKHCAEFGPVAEHLRQNGYTLVAVDNIPEFNPQNVYDAEIPEKVAFIYGEEGSGIPADIIKECDMMLYIPQYGSVRSLNVSQAAAVMMSEYNRRHRPR